MTDNWDFFIEKGPPSPTSNQKIKIDLSPLPSNKRKKRLPHSPPETKKK